MKINDDEEIIKEKRKKPVIRKRDAEDNDEDDNNTLFNLSEVIVIMIICISFGLLIGTYIASNKVYYTEDNLNIDFNEMLGLYEDIKNNYYGRFTSPSIRDDTIEGMLSHLDDQYARLITKETASNYKEELESEYVGIGIEMVIDEDNLHKVTRVYDESPAMKSGIKVDDYIIKINGEDISELSIIETNARINGGTRGDKVEITFVSNGEEKTKNISKEIVAIPTVDINYINENDKKIVEFIIKTFSKNTYKDFWNLYEKVKEDNIDGIIIDLRDNGGGYLSAASKVTSLFLDNKTIIYIQKNNNKEDKIYSDNNKVIDEKIVILINGGTASGSEVMASALKENLNVTLVGEQSYGKNTIQKIHELNDGSIVKFTIGEWLTSNRNNVSENKIVPDIELTNNENVKKNSEEDIVLKRAISVILED